MNPFKAGDWVENVADRSSGLTLGKRYLVTEADHKTVHFRSDTDSARFRPYGCYRLVDDSVTGLDQIKAKVKDWGIWA